MSKYELVVMGFLLDRPMHGYQINQEVKVHRMDSWAKISPPMIYKTLAALDREGMVVSRREREGLMPERRVFRLTQRGRERLARLVERSLLDKNITYDLSNLGYFFIFALDKEKALDCLRQKKGLLQRTLRSLEKRMSDFKGKTPANRFLVLEKDYDRFQSELRHLERMIDRVERCDHWAQETFLGPELAPTNGEAVREGR
ncbi:MAG: PadR family transcriptional regulator [Thermodesulfobacteriota bacterium]